MKLILVGSSPCGAWVSKKELGSAEWDKLKKKKKAPNYVITQNEQFILMTPCHPEEVKCGIFHKVREVC